MVSLIGSEEDAMGVIRMHQSANRCYGRLIHQPLLRGLIPLLLHLLLLLVFQLKVKSLTYNFELPTVHKRRR